MLKSRLFKENKSIKKTIIKSFFISMFIMMLISGFAALYFNALNSKQIRLNNLQHTDGILSRFLIPEVSINNTSEVMRLLGLASDNDKFYAVVDQSRDILLSNYRYEVLVKNVLNGNKIYGHCESANVIYKKINGNFYWIYCSPLLSDSVSSKGEKLGILLSFSTHVSTPSMSILLSLLLIIFLVFSCLVYWFRLILHRKLLVPLLALYRSIKNKKRFLDGDFELGPIKGVPTEIKVINEQFNSLVEQLKSEYLIRAEFEKRQVLYDLAEKLAHDIRSPLGAIDMILASENSNMQQKSSLLIRGAIGRVHDIANGLLEENRNVHLDTEIPSCLYLIITSVVDEMKMLLMGSGVSLSFNVDERSYFTMSKLNVVDFKRALVNIINNAIDAMTEGEIDIRLNCSESESVLQISDTGCGIPDFILQQLGEKKGVTYGKNRGNGLGLFYVKSTLNSWGGSLNINSEVNKGTCVTMALPKMATSFYYSVLQLKNISCLIIVDDDQSTHDVWDTFALDNNIDIPLQHFYSYSELFSSHENIIEREGAMFFCDQHILNDDLTGIEAIEHYLIDCQTVLVTNCYDSCDVLDACQRLTIPLLPKPLIQYLAVTDQ